MRVSVSVLLIIALLQFSEMLVVLPVRSLDLMTGQVRASAQLQGVGERLSPPETLAQDVLDILRPEGAIAHCVLQPSLILDSGNSVLVSPATYWEIAIKVSIGKLALRQPYEDFAETCTRRYRFGLLPIEPAHTARVASMPFPSNHKDPFDRLLVAQALVENMPIVSADAALDEYNVQRLCEQPTANVAKFGGEP